MTPDFNAMFVVGVGFGCATGWNYRDWKRSIPLLVIGVVLVLLS